MERRWIAYTLAMPVLFGACSPPDAEPDASSEHFDLFLLEGVEACAGALPALERFVANSVAHIGVPLPPGWRAELHVMPFDALKGHSPCPSGAGGCAGQGGTPRAWIASYSAEYHETMHLIGHETMGSPPPAFSEGLATNWGNSPLSRLTVDHQAIEALFRVRPDETWSRSGYAPAAALTHMLLGDYGDAYFDVFAELPRDAPYEDIVASFSSYFGDPFDIVIDRFTSAHQCTEPLWVCAESEAETSGLPLEVEGMDCDDEATAGFRSLDSFGGLQPYRVERFSLDADSRLETTMTDVFVTFHPCGRCDTETLVVGTEGHETVEFQLRAGEWTVVIEPNSESSAFRLRIAK